MDPQIRYDSQQLLADNDEVPAEVRNGIAKQIATEKEQRVQEIREKALKGQAILAEFQTQLEELIGSNRYRQFREWVEGKRRSGGPGGTNEGAYEGREERWPTISEPPQVELQNVERGRKRQESIAFLHSLGVEVDRIEELEQQTRQRLDQLYVGLYGHGAISEIVLPSDVPSELQNRERDSGASSPTIEAYDKARAEAATLWTTYAPPFAGWWWEFWWSTNNGNFQFSFDRYLDSGTGFVGSSNRASDASASNNDQGESHYRSTIGFWFQMPVEGALEMWVESVARAANHYVQLEDEWGSSDARISQSNYIMLKVDGPTAEPWIGEKMSGLNLEGYTDGWWHVIPLTIGATYWTHWMTRARFPAGSWIYIRIGSETLHIVYANDVKVSSGMISQWVISSVHVRVV